MSCHFLLILHCVINPIARRPVLSIKSAHIRRQIRQMPCHCCLFCCRCAHSQASWRKKCVRACVILCGLCVRTLFRKVVEIVRGRETVNIRDWLEATLRVVTNHKGLVPNQVLEQTKFDEYTIQFSFPLQCQHSQFPTAFDLVDLAACRASMRIVKAACLTSTGIWHRNYRKFGIISGPVTYFTLQNTI